MIQKIINNITPAYEILDYIITPSSSEVNTEVLVNGTTVVEMTCTLRQRSWQAPRFFSSNDTNTDVPGWNQAGTWGLQFEDSGTNLSIKMLGADYSRLSDAVIVRTGITYNDLANKKLRYNLTAAGILTIFNTDDTVFSSYDATAETDTSATSSTPIKLFHRYTSNEYLNNQSYVYDVKIWDNDVLIRHYLPVKRLSDSVYGLYDIINNTFHQNEISGYSFSGTSKSTPEYIDESSRTTKYVNDIIINGTQINRIYLNGEVYWGGEITQVSPIPSQYTPVNYIRSVGSSDTNMSYINTGWRCSNNTVFEYKIVLPSDRTAYARYSNVLPYGAHTWTSASTKTDGELSFTILMQNSDLRFMGSRNINDYDNEVTWSNVPSYGLNDGTRHEIIATISTLSFDVTVDNNNSVLTPTSGPWSGLDGTNNTISELYLFTGQWPVRGSSMNEPLAPATFITQEMYYFKIYDNGTLVRDYVPVYDTVSQKYGLYDKVNGTFNTSQNNNYNFTGPAI